MLRPQTSGVYDPLVVKIEAVLEHRRMLVLVTDSGDLDLTITPAAFPRGYADLIGAAVEMDLGAGVVHVAALRDVIASKEAADRDKDRVALPYLRALADELGQ